MIQSFLNIKHSPKQKKQSDIQQKLDISHTENYQEESVITHNTKIFHEHIHISGKHQKEFI